MRPQLLFLSGPRRGRTDTPSGLVVRIGTAVQKAHPPAAVRSVPPQHAEIVFGEAGCAFHLRVGDGEVFVDNQQVQEVILKLDDLIEFGVGGP